MPRNTWLAILAGMACGTATAAPPALDETDRRIVEAFLQHTRRLPERVTAEGCRRMAAEKPEGFTWELMPYLEMPLVAYRLTEDPAYLDLFVAGFQPMREAMTVGPDGFLGWYGKALTTFRHPDHPDRPVDVQINSFRATEILSRFIELIDADPALRARFAPQRAAYLDLMTRHLVEKWTARGNYVDLGAHGAVYRTHFDLKVDKGNLTQPGNKLSIIAQGLLALYRVTGEDRYMATAVKLGAHFRRRLTLGEDFYTWNYWDPAGAWDVLPQPSNRWKHWIGAEHRSGYYSHSVGLAAALYHHGVVFDERDMARFVRTQTKRAWNGDLENPVFYRVDRSQGPQAGDYVSGALAPWDARLAAFLYEGPRREARLAAAAHAWQGGPAAAGWIRGKYLDLPAAAGGRRRYAEAGERFRRRPENRALLETLSFEIVGRGYQAPRAPADWPDMPADPGRPPLNRRQGSATP